VRGIDHPALIASVRAALGDTKPAAIALDTLNRSLAGSESDARDMANRTIGEHHSAAENFRIRPHYPQLGIDESKT
jgi:hypothetical protein